jgi:hypothetical protein
MKESFLINFNIPNYLKRNFDYIVGVKKISRTSVLVGMVEEYCRKEIKLIQEDINLTNQIVGTKEHQPNKPKRKWSIMT